MYSGLGIEVVIVFLFFPSSSILESNSFKYMLLRMGDIMLPCGVPFSVFSNLPFVFTPALRIFHMSYNLDLLSYVLVLLSVP